MTTLRCFWLKGLWLNSTQPLRFHDICHLSSSRGDSSIGELFDDPPSSISSSMFPENIHDDRRQFSLGHLVSVQAKLLVFVKSRSWNGQAFTNIAYLKTTLETCLISRCNHVTLSLRLKMANAFFKISRSRSTRRSSASN